MFNPMMIMQLAAGAVGEIFPEKKKQADVLARILGLPGMAAGVLGKSSSTGLKIGSELSKSTVEGLANTDGSIMSRIVGMNEGGDLTQPGLFNSMQIGSSGISNSVGKNIPTIHNPLDLFN